MNTARDAYNAWCSGFEDETGVTHPRWEELAPATKAGWVNAVHAVRTRERHHLWFGWFLAGCAIGALALYLLTLLLVQAHGH